MNLQQLKYNVIVVYINDKVRYFTYMMSLLALRSSPLGKKCFRKNLF